jgi:hypothetical protein
LGFKLTGRSHTVVRLPVHEEDNPVVVFQPTRRSAEQRAARPPEDNLLRAFFRLNESHGNVAVRGGILTKDLLYHQVPEYFRVQAKGSKRMHPGAYKCKWVQRMQCRKVIGRLNMVDSRDCQANALRNLTAALSRRHLIRTCIFELWSA